MRRKRPPNPWLPDGSCLPNASHPKDAANPRLRGFRVMGGTGLEPVTPLLQKQTKVLQRRLANDEGELFANWSGDACSLALTADVLQGTWGR
jgi:hypothetical protein